MITAIIGGCLIAFSGLLLFYYNRQIAGISGMIEGILPPSEGDRFWRLQFLLGLIFGGIVLKVFYPLALTFSFDVSHPLIVLAGLLVGVGSRLGLGCTSGHGVCGVGRGAFRSLLATTLFIIFGFLTATCLRWS